MARSIRLIYRNVFQRKWFNFNWPPITRNSQVLVTAAEWKAGNDPFDATGRPNLGDATVRVTNVGPHDPEGSAGGVEFCVHVDHPHPLHVQVTITVLEPVEEIIHAS